MNKVKYITRVEKVGNLTWPEKYIAEIVSNRYKFRANDYYLGLINWADPDDPIKRIVIPQAGELEEFGQLDASNEEINYVAAGTQHKYDSTVLLLVNETCGAFCRFCFRKRLFMDDNFHSVHDISEGIEYIRRNNKITNVLLTGGDPLLLSTGRLEKIISRIRRIDHVKIIRIGSKMPAFNPYRIINNPDLPAMLAKYSYADKRIYLMTHFNVANELSREAISALEIIRGAGIIILNQTPIIGGVNDRPDRLAELFQKLSFIGVPPYYLFQCRPTEGNKPFSVPIVRAYHVFHEAMRRVSGLAKQARFVMSHERGKIEIVGVSNDHIYLRYHRARNPRDDERFLIYHRDDNACWLDDLKPVVKENSYHAILLDHLGRQIEGHA